MVKNMLTKKLFKDMWAAKWQFLSIILLCMLGVMMFCGLDAAWRDIDVSLDRYFKEQNLSDLWVKLPQADKAAVSKISNMEGVAAVQARIVEDGIAKELPQEPTVKVHGYDGPFAMNVPRITEGTELANHDIRGCVIETQFAEAQGLGVGDSIEVTVDDEIYSFIIRGLVISPEHIWSANDVLPDPDTYGYILIQSIALPALKFNEVMVRIEQNADINDIKSLIEQQFPYSLVITHNTHVSTSNILAEVSQFQSFSIVFPILFFAVSAMMVLTTIARMVDSQRTQMGTLKALGYKEKKLFIHYMSYGLYPSLFGSLVGLIVGRTFLPGFLWRTEGEMYTLPEKVTAMLSPAAIIVCLLVVILAMGISYFGSCRQLKETAAELMRPKPPKVGSRILFERFTRLWRWLSFNTKLICRNVFRAKVRSMMALFGVLACTMLLIVSLGMNDTFRHMVSSYYEETYTNDLRVMLERNAGTLQSYQKRLPAEDVEGVMDKNISLHGRETSRTALLTVVADSQKLIAFDSELGPADVPDAGVIMTEKLAELMGLTAGDDVMIILPGDKQPIHTHIAALSSISISQGIFLSESVWNTFSKGAFIPTALLIKGPTSDCLSMLDQLDTVQSYIFSTEQSTKTESAMQGLIGVVVLLFVFALKLAAVVLYNMGVLNFIERTREYATLKVLGYHKKEVRWLIVMENALISISGAVLGIIPGMLLTSIAMKMAEPDDMVMNAIISPLSIVTACLVTVVFSLIIQLFLVRKVDAIDMVGALKSVE